MSTFVRTTYTTHPLLKMSKMVVVLLLIFFPVIALANPVFQSSSNRNSSPSAVGSQSMQYQLESYKMANTSTYQVGTTYNPAQTIYEPFSNANPSSSSPSRIGGRKNIEGDENDPNGDINYGDGDDYGGNDDPGDADSPLGDAWSLLIFAAMAAVVITLRKKQTA